MLQIILIRPGSTDYDQEERIQGSLDVPLNELGSNEVAAVIEQLYERRIEAVYAPASQPSQQTGRAIAKALGVKFRKMERMQNLNQGLWQGMLVDEVRRKQPKVYKQWQEQPENVCPPEGEMISEAAGRVRTAMTKLLKRHKQGAIAVVVPEPLASLVRHFFLHGELGDLWKVNNGRGRWEVLDIEPKEVLQNGG
jgi:probable phosphoglycerate mutase